MNENITKIKEVYDPIQDKMIPFDYKEELENNGMLTVWTDEGLVTLYKEPIKGVKL